MYLHPFAIHCVGICVCVAVLNYLHSYLQEGLRKITKLGIVGHL